MGPAADHRMSAAPAPEAGATAKPDTAGQIAELDGHVDRIGARSARPGGATCLAATPIASSANRQSAVVISVDAQHHYFPADLAAKQAKLRALIATVAGCVEHIPANATSGQRARVAYLHGKALDAEPDCEHGEAAVALLSKAVKLDPSLIAAWNSLGECFLQQKPPNVDSARNCFERAIAKQRNSVSLRDLSLLLRQVIACGRER